MAKTKQIELTEIEIGERRLVRREVDGVLRWHIQYLYAVLDEAGRVYKQGEMFVLVDEKYADLFEEQIRAADDAVRFGEDLLEEPPVAEDPADVIKPKGKVATKGASHV